jgi:predicted transcriptional regulator
MFLLILNLLKITSLPDVMLNDISEIKKVRRNANLTQKQLAQKAGVSQSLIAKIEAGEIDPAFSKAKRILDALSEVHTKKRARELLNKGLISAHPTDSLNKSINIMRKHGISQMPVIDDRKVIGLVSEATILDALIDDKRKETPLRDIMGDAPPVITPEASLDVVTQLLKEYPIILVSEKGRILGHITKADVLARAYR